MRPDLRSREAVLVAVLALAGWAVAAYMGHATKGAAVQLAFVGAWALLGFAGVVAWAAALLALGSSSYVDAKALGLDVRWIGLGTLAVWPVVSRRSLLPSVDRRLLSGAAAFTGLAVVSVAWSIDPRISLQRVGAFAALLFVALVVLPAHARTADERVQIARALGALGVMGAVAAITAGKLDPEIANTGGALRGWLENSNTNGLWCVALLPMLFAWPRALAIPGALVILTSVVLSDARSALLGLVLLVLLVLPLPPLKRLAVAAAAVGVVLILAASPAGDLLDRTGFGKFTDGDGTAAAVTGGRSEAWEETLDLIQDAPLQGYGFGASENAFFRAGFVMRFRTFQGANPNNAYLQAGLEMGLLGALLLLAVAVAAIIIVLRLPPDPSRRPWVLATVSLFAAAAVESILTSPGNPFALIAWAGLGVALSVDSSGWRREPHRGT